MLGTLSWPFFVCIVEQKTGAQKLEFRRMCAGQTIPWYSRLLHLYARTALRRGRELDSQLLLAEQIVAASSPSEIPAVVGDPSWTWSGQPRGVSIIGKDGLA